MIRKIARSEGLTQRWHNLGKLFAMALLVSVAAMAAVLMRPSAAAESAAQGTAQTRIGIIGAGRMGSTLASLWADAGYQVMISSRNPAALQSLVQSIGHGVQAGSSEDAAKFGTVIVIAVPYAAEPQLGQSSRPNWQERS